MTPKKIDDLYQLIDGIDVCLMTTHRADGALVSRPMQTQARERGCDLWFVTTTDTHKLEELENDPHVNLGYYKDREWVSVSGLARLSQDRGRIHALYKPEWKIWLGDGDGGPDDPRLALIEVEAISAHYFKRDRPKPMVLFELAKSTGKPDEVTKLDPEDLRIER